MALGGGEVERGGVVAVAKVDGDAAILDLSLINNRIKKCFITEEKSLAPWRGSSYSDHGRL